MKNGLDEQYIDLLKDILENGVEKNTRNGKVLSVFGRSIRYKFKDGKFPLITTKKMYFKGIVTELLWFLRGDTNIKYLIDNNCHIWDGDCFSHYLKNVDDTIKNKFGIGPIIYGKEEFINKIKTDGEFAKKWGNLGPVYGKQWRSWGTYEYEGINRTTTEFSDNVDVNWTQPIDQIANLIRDIKTNPDSRRLMVNAWNVGELDSMVLPPCHYGFQVYTRELSLEERIQQIPFSEKHTIHERNECIDDLRTLKGDELKSFEQYIKQQCDSIHTPNRAISLMWNQRSVDTFLGLPFNIASYGLLLEIIAKETNMIPDELVGNLGDTHLYLDHIEQAKEQIGRELSLEERTELAKGIVVPLLGSKEDSYNEAGIAKRTREPFPLPTLILDDWYSTQGDPLNTPQDISKFLKDINIAHIRVENYQSHPTIKAPLSN
jgi:thymidylate synthase